MGATISSYYATDPKPPGERRFISKWSRDPQRLAPHEGDILEFYRCPEHSHFGIYMGDGKVAHFNAVTDLDQLPPAQRYRDRRSQSVQSESEIDIHVFARDQHLPVNKFMPGVVTISDLDDVAKMPGSLDKINKVRINNKPALREIPRRLDEIRALIEKLQETPPGWLKYCSNLFNCEHFVTYVKFGRSFTEQRWGTSVEGTPYDTREVKRLFREVFYAQAVGKPITVYDSQCYWIVHFMDRVRQQWEEYLRAVDADTEPKLLIEELHMEIEDFMYALEKTDCHE